MSPRILSRWLIHQIKNVDIPYVSTLNLMFEFRYGLLDSAVASLNVSRSETVNPFAKSLTSSDISYFPPEISQFHAVTQAASGRGTSVGVCQAVAGAQRRRRAGRRPGVTVTVAT